MSRDITVAALAALEAENLRPVLLVELAFASGTIRMSNLDLTVTWDSEDWLGLGRIGKIAAIEESEAIQAHGIVLTATGIDPAIVAIALGEHYQGRRVRIWLGLFDANYAVIADPVLIYRGRMDTMRVVNGQEATVQIACEGRLADFARARIRRYNSADQQIVHPDDRFFDFAPQIAAGQALYWGVVAPAGAA